MVQCLIPFNDVSRKWRLVALYPTPGLHVSPARRGRPPQWPSLPAPQPRAPLPHGSLRTLENMCIQPQAPADAWPQSKPTNMQEQQTWLATKGILQERYKKVLGRLRETQGMPIMLRHCQVTPRNAGNSKGNTGNALNATPLPSHTRKRRAHNIRNTQTE